MSFDQRLESPLVAGLHRQHEGDVFRCGIRILGGAWGHLREKKRDITTEAGERLAKFLSPRVPASGFFVCP
jgi:hypothetical protein